MRISNQDTLTFRHVASILLALILVALSGSRFSRADAAEAVSSPIMTPLILSVQDAPIPFKGSDGNEHLWYELFVTNFTSLTATVEQVEILGDGKVIQTLDREAVSRRLQPAGQ